MSIPYNRAKQIAYDAGAIRIDTVASYLVHCNEDDDIRNSLRGLRANSPELFLQKYRSNPEDRR